MCAKGTATASPIPNLLVLLTGRQEVSPYWGGWLDRLPFCPVTDTLHMCHSCGLVTSPPRKEDEMRRRREANRSAPTDNAVSSFFCPTHWNRHRPHVSPSHPRKTLSFFSGRGGCLGPALLSASRARLTVSAKCHSCRKKGALTPCFYTTAALLRSTDTEGFFYFLQ